MKKQISINGMTCGHCVRHVEEALEGIIGAFNVRVNLQGKYAMVEVTDAVSDEKLKEAIEEAGYNVTGINNL